MVQPSSATTCSFVLVVMSGCDQVWTEKCWLPSATACIKLPSFSTTLEPILQERKPQVSFEHRAHTQGPEGTLT